MKLFFVILTVMLTGCASAPKLTENAFGGVSIGMSAEHALAVMHDYAAEYYDETSDCYYLHPKGEVAGVHIMINDEIVARFDVADNGERILTAAGVGIGSTKQDVINSYSQVNIKPHQYLGEAGEYLEVTLPSGTGFIFETEFDVVTQYRLGQYPEVQYVEGCL